MKTKKNKLTNLLKLGILFFGMILVFNNCQKEENYIVETPSPINLEKAKKMFAAQFNKEIFPNLNPSPIWEEAKADYDNEGYFYYEIPFHLLNKKDINMSTSVSFDRLIVQEKEGALKFKIIHFFNINIKSNPVNYQNLSHKELLNFSGFITEYDINKNIVAINYYKNGEDTYQKVKISNKKKDNLLSKANENSEEFSETYCNRWCVTYRGQDGSIEYGNCTDWVCHTSYYYLDEGSNSNNNGGNGDGNNTSYTSTNKECAEGYALNYDGKCVALPKIINELTGKADCVYGKMVDNNNNINWILENFNDGNKPSEFDLKLTMGTFTNPLTNASTVKNGNTFTIKINQNNLDRSSLSIARTIIHEGIHARLREFASRKGSNATTFPSIYEYFRKYKNNWDHQQMADYYRSTIAKGLKQYDNAQHSDQFYNDMAWEGLANIVDANNQPNQIYTEAWKKLTPTEKKRIENTITNEKKNGNKTCK